MKSGQKEKLAVIFPLRRRAKSARKGNGKSWPACE
jgi:hypothetical protein